LLLTPAMSPITNNRFCIGALLLKTAKWGNQWVF